MKLIDLAVVVLTAAIFSGTAIFATLVWRAKDGKPSIAATHADFIKGRFEAATSE